MIDLAEMEKKAVEHNKHTSKQSTKITLTKTLSIRFFKVPLYLVVEDSHSGRQFFKTALKNFSQKFYIDFALNGLEGIDKVKQRLYHGFRYDVIFMDYFMPGLNGDATARIIREEEKNFGIKNRIVAFTGRQKEEGDEELFDLSCCFLNSRKEYARRRRDSKVLGRGVHEERGKLITI